MKMRALVCHAYGPIEGLKLEVTGGATGTRGAVDFSHGYAQRLDVLLDQFLSGTGLSGGDWLHWMWSLTDWVDRKEAHPILRPTMAQADTLTGDITVGMAADWGTGLYGAPKIAESRRP
jgi:hypothetical protein